MASAKRFAGSRENNKARRLILGDRVELALQRREHRFRQRIKALWPVECYCDHASRILTAQNDRLLSPESLRHRRSFD